MSSESTILFSNLTDAQKESYIKFMIENEVPLEEDTQQRDSSFVATITLPSTFKAINHKYSTQHQQQQQQQPSQLQQSELTSENRIHTHQNQLNKTENHNTQLPKIPQQIECRSTSQTKTPRIPQIQSSMRSRISTSPTLNTPKQQRKPAQSSNRTIDNKENIPCSRPTTPTPTLISQKLLKPRSSTITSKLHEADSKQITPLKVRFDSHNTQQNIPQSGLTPASPYNQNNNKKQKSPLTKAKVNSINDSSDQNKSSNSQNKNENQNNLSNNNNYNSILNKENKQPQRNQHQFQSNSSSRESQPRILVNRPSLSPASHSSYHQIPQLSAISATSAATTAATVASHTTTSINTLPSYQVFSAKSAFPTIQPPTKPRENILIIENDSTSRTGSSCSNISNQSINFQQQQRTTTHASTSSPTNQINKLSQERKNEILEILQSVGFNYDRDSFPYNNFLTNSIGTDEKRLQSIEKEQIFQDSRSHSKEQSEPKKNQQEKQNLHQFQLSQKTNSNYYHSVTQSKSNNNNNKTNIGNQQNYFTNSMENSSSNYFQPILSRIKHQPSRVSKLPLNSVLTTIEDILSTFAHSIGIKEGQRNRKRFAVLLPLLNLEDFMFEYFISSYNGKNKKQTTALIPTTTTTTRNPSSTQYFSQTQESPLSKSRSKTPPQQSKKASISSVHLIDPARKLAEVNLYNFLKSVEYHDSIAKSTNHPCELVNSFVFLLTILPAAQPKQQSTTLKQEILYIYLAFLIELQAHYKSKLLLNQSTSLKTLSKLFSGIAGDFIFKVFEFAGRNQDLNVTTTKVMNGISTTTINVYSFLNSLLDFSTLSQEHARMFKCLLVELESTQLQRIRNNISSQSSSSSSVVIAGDSSQHLFAMVNDSFGVMTCSPNSGNGLHVIEEFCEQGNDMWIHCDQTDKQMVSKQQQQQQYLQQQSRRQFPFQFQLEAFVLEQMEAIVMEFVSMFVEVDEEEEEEEVVESGERDRCRWRQQRQAKRNRQKMHDLISKKCRLLVISLLMHERDKWFELLAIRTPDAQQIAQAETIQRLFEAYCDVFVSDGPTDDSVKNFRTVCKLILKIPELSEAIRKLLICVLASEQETEEEEKEEKGKEEEYN